MSLGLAAPLSAAPDLTVSISGITPSSVAAGSSTTVTYSVCNQGSGTASNIAVRFWLSSNATLGGDTHLGYDNVGSRAAGTCGSDTFPANIPAGTALGTWYIIAQVDPNNAIDEGTTGESNNTGARSFTVSGCSPPASFNLTSPTNGSTLATGTASLTLDWNDSSGATSYDLYFGPSNPPSLHASDLTSSSRNVSVPAGQTYYWQVRARNSCGSTPSSTWSFTNPASCAAPGGFSLSSPNDGTHFAATTGTVTLSWTASANADSYNVHFDESSSPSFKASRTTNSYTASVSSGKTYWWKIIARRNCGSSISSTTRSFVVDTPSGGSLRVQVFQAGGTQQVAGSELNSLELWRNGAYQTAADPAAGDHTFANLAAGFNYRVDAYGTDMYLGTTGDVAISSGSNESRRIDAPAQGTLQVRVLYSDGSTPLPGATVEVKSHESTVWRAGTTRSDGWTSWGGSDRASLFPNTQAGETWTIEAKSGGVSIAPPVPVSIASNVNVQKTIVSNVARTPVYGTTILVHGYTATEGSVESEAAWVLSMARAILERAGGQGRVLVYEPETGLFVSPADLPASSAFRRAAEELGMHFGFANEAAAAGETVLAFDWIDESNRHSTGFSEAAGSALFAALMDPRNGGPGALAHSHFICHSRGCVVTSEAVQRLLAVSDSLAPERVTMIDPVDQGYFDSVTEVKDYDVNPELPQNGFVAWNRGDTVYEVYYSTQNGGDCFSPNLDPNGRALDGAINVLLDHEAGGEEVDHCDAHAWYHGTIDLEVEDDGNGIDIQDHWYGPGDRRCGIGNEDHRSGARRLEGFNLSRLGGLSQSCGIRGSRAESRFGFDAVGQGIVNGDFTDPKNELIPGWGAHGGGGSASRDGRGYLSIEGDERLTSDRFYIPSNAAWIAWTERVVEADGDDVFRVSLPNGAASHSHTIDHAQAALTHALDVRSLAGTIQTLTFELTGNGFGGGEVAVDDVRFVLDSCPYLLTVDLVGSGRVTSPGGEISCPSDCSHCRAQTTAVTLQPLPGAESVFSGWSGDPDCSDGIVEASANVSCTATFHPAAVPQSGLCYIDEACSAGNQYRVRDALSGECVSIHSCTEIWKCAAGPTARTCGGGSIDCAFSPGCGGDVQTCSAGACTNLTNCTDRIKYQGSSPTPTPNQCGCSGACPQETLTLIVETRGSGSGTVSSSPPGVDCGADCWSLFPDDSTIVLSASPEAGSSFGGWSGDPDCSDGAVTLDASKTCAATFVLDPGVGFYPVLPCRIVDTRGSGGTLASSVNRYFPIAGLCGIPSSAKAVSANLTVVGGTGPGHLSLWPADLGVPPISNLNFSAGQTRANNAILRLATDGWGDIAARAFVSGNGTVHLVVDVNGYFQ